VLPGLTETSLLPQALEAAGHDLGWVYAELARAAQRG
jgi:D-alanine-D-alanine ligase